MSVATKALDKSLPRIDAEPGGPAGVRVALDRGDGGGEPFADPRRLGLWAFLGTVSMMFIGFTSSYIVRRTGGDWRPLEAPPLIWLNTAVLLLSSAVLEGARSRLRSWDPGGARRLLGASGILGLLFVVGQLGAWRQLAAQGVYLASNPHSSFFYLLTGLHGLHLAGGLIWFVAAFRALTRPRLGPDEDGLGLFATYWHFLAGLWLYLLLLLFVF